MIKPIGEDFGPVKTGQDLLVAGSAALSGALQLTHRREAELLGRYSVSFIRQMKECERYLISEEQLIKSGISDYNHIWPVGDGGIMNALWFMLEESKAGMQIDLKKIPVRQETIEVCEYFDVNPYRLQSSGCYLLAADHGQDVCSRLSVDQIAAAVIGKVTPGIARLIKNGENQSYLDRPAKDEINKVL